MKNVKSKPGMLTAIIAGVVVIGTVKAFVGSPEPTPKPAAGVSVSECQSAFDELSLRHNLDPSVSDAELERSQNRLEQLFKIIDATSCVKFLQNGDVVIPLKGRS